LACAILGTDTTFDTTSKKQSWAERVPIRAAFIGLVVRLYNHAIVSDRTSLDLTAEKINNRAAPLLWNTARMRDALLLGSRLMTRMHQERCSAARGLPRMETFAQYREFAVECYRLASIAKTDEHRKMLREMAHAWRKVAEEAEQTETQS